MLYEVITILLLINLVSGKITTELTNFIMTVCLGSSLNPRIVNGVNTYQNEFPQIVTPLSTTLPF